MKHLPLALSVLGLSLLSTACSMEGLFGATSPAGDVTPSPTPTEVAVSPPLFRGYARFKKLIWPEVATLGTRIEVRVQLEWNDACPQPTTIYQTATVVPPRLSFTAMVEAGSGSCAAVPTLYEATLSFLPPATGTFTVSSPESGVQATLSVIPDPRYPMF